jgi:hypothetical protein
VASGAEVVAQLKALRRLPKLNLTAPEALQRLRELSREIRKSLAALRTDRDARATGHREALEYVRSILEAAP